MRRVLIAAALAFGWGVGAAAAADLHLDGDRYWVSLARRRNINEAIGLARWYASISPSVVKTADGSYAVVSGPRTVAAGAERTTLAGLVDTGTVPPDATLDHGETYFAVAWTSPPSPILATARYDGQRDATLDLGPLHVVLSKSPADGGGFVPTATGTLDGKPAFVMTAQSQSGSETPAARVTIVRLDRAAPGPQVILSYFWQGAHCCTVTRIATEHPDGSWHVVDGETLDGDRGYRFEDLTGTGEVDLTSADQAFYYAFASYASSVAPSRIHQLVGDRLVDVTREPRFYEVLLQNVAALESSVKPDDPAWHDNGFLAGWIAEKMLVGQGSEAWTRMLADYDHNPDFGPERCTIDRPLASCPDDRKARIPFPVALKSFLIERGYILDTALYPLPKPATVPVAAPAQAVAAPPSGIPPELQRCVSDSDSARRLIYQAFVGRRLQPGEAYDPVSLEADTTLEANDTSIGRIVCAVTYDVDLKKLAEELAAHGEAARAAAIDKLLKRVGPVSTARIKYSVKPTATPGQNYVELLP